MLRVSTTQGNVGLYVTNRYAPGRGPASALPSASSYQWAAPVAGPLKGVVYIAHDDPNVTACNLPSVTCADVYVMAVVGRGAGAAVFSIIGSSTESPIVLIPGTPSAPMVLPAGSVAHFAVDVADLTNDLISEFACGGVATLHRRVAPTSGDHSVPSVPPPTHLHPPPGSRAPLLCAVATTVYEGALTTTVGWNASDVSTLPGCSNTFPPVCTGQWDDTRNLLPHVITIAASAPCAVPPAVLPCDPQLAWRAGKYYIGE